MKLDVEWLAQNYNALRSVAYELMRKERRRREHTLQPTDLVNEVVKKLKAGEVDNPWAVVRTMMMRHLIEHARRRMAGKRDWGTRVELQDVFTPGGASLETVLTVRDALDRYRKMQPRSAMALEMKLLAMMQLGEIAEKLGVSLATVKNDLADGKAWLRAQLEGLGG